MKSANDFGRAVRGFLLVSGLAGLGLLAGCAEGTTGVDAGLSSEGELSSETLFSSGELTWSSGTPYYSGTALSSGVLALSSEGATSSAVNGSSNSNGSSTVAGSSGIVAASSTGPADPGGNISRTVNGYPLVIHSSRTVASLQLSQSAFDSWNVDAFYTASNRNTLTQALYQAFDDDFDLIFFVSNNATKPANLDYYGIHMAVSSLNSGMGMNAFNSNTGGQATGSAGKLKSYVHFGARNSMQNGPTLHEICHMWGQFFQDDVEYPDPNGGAATSAAGHWGWAASGKTRGGQLGGFAMNTLVNLGSGLWQANAGGGSTSFDGFANGGNGLPYSDFEMYLAGFWPKDSVGTLRVFHGVQVSQAEYPNGQFHATSYNDYTIDQLETTHGARTPSYLTSQKDYRVLVVVLTPAPLTTTEWDEVSAQTTWFTQKSDDGLSYLYNFWEATRGLGSMTANGLWGSLKP